MKHSKLRLLDWTTANQITLFGGLLAVIGIVLFTQDYNYTAAGILIVSFLTDALDGAVGRYQQNDLPEITREQEANLTLWEKLNYRGVTHFGRTLDPLIDKIRFVGLLWVLGPGHVPVIAIAAITVLAVLLTLVRPVKNWLKLDTVGSNSFGKFKVYTEVVTIAILAFATRPLIPWLYGLHETTAGNLALLFSLIVALCLAGASLYRHLRSAWTFLRVRSRV